MTPRERIERVLSGGVPDRVPFHDIFWQTTVERWRGEGLPPDVSADEYFGCEIARLSADYTLGLPVQTIEKTDRYHIYIDANGARRKDMITPDGWTPNWLDFEIKGRDDWYRLKDHAGYNPSRIPEGIKATYDSERRKGRFVTYSVHAPFHPTWHKIGMENLLIWMIEDPEFITDMFAAHTQLVIDLYEGMKALGIGFDGAWLNDDLGYLTASLISPSMYRDLLMPYHKKLCDHFAPDGLKTILHSDGDVGALIPHFLEAGFAALHPLEAKVGLDVRELKPKYGDRLVLFGNIDVRALAGNREEIEAEIGGKVSAAKEGGGYIYHSDHSVPSDVSLENYRFALEMLKKYGEYE